MPSIAVISQPMFMPWVGLFEQVRLADIFIHYDDVQLPQGRSFMSRVQIKTPAGGSWMTAPIDRKHSGRLINETFFLPDTDWRDKHLKHLKHAYSRAPFFDVMLEMAHALYSNSSNNLAEFNLYAIERISNWLGFTPKFMRSSEVGIGGSGTQRLVDLCREVDADAYVTGLGALNYLDYSQFETHGISVRYMDYEKRPYPQLHGEFTPYVSILDTIANCGHGATENICSESTFWKEYNVGQN